MEKYVTSLKLSKKLYEVGFRSRGVLVKTAKVSQNSTLKGLVVA